jgi:hypothetical protein
MAHPRGGLAAGAVWALAGVQRLLLAAGIRPFGMVEGPVFAVDEDKRAAFDASWTATRGEGILPDDALPYPKHEFLSYLVHRRGFLLHGGGTTEGGLLAPTLATDFGRRRSGVFAASDGIWPIFFATLDRGVAGDIFNGCLHGGRGSRLRRFYFFFIESDPHDARTWHSGSVHVLEPSGFRKTFVPNELVHEGPARPLATVRVTPDDFPLVGSVLRLDPDASPFANLYRESRRPRRRS